MMQIMMIYLAYAIACNPTAYSFLAELQAIVPDRKGRVLPIGNWYAAKHYGNCKYSRKRMEDGVEVAKHTQKLVLA